MARGGMKLGVIGTVVVVQRHLCEILLGGSTITSRVVTMRCAKGNVFLKGSVQVLTVILIIQVQGIETCFHAFTGFVVFWTIDIDTPGRTVTTETVQRSCRTGMIGGRTGQDSNASRVLTDLSVVLEGRSQPKQVRRQERNHHEAYIDQP